MTYIIIQEVYMAAKTANLYARIEPETKGPAEAILAALGIPVSTAINMFYKQIILQQGIPFEVKLPKAPENAAKWSKERFDAELEKGYNDMLKGRTRPAAMVLSDVKKKYNV
jgi:addiction module RelB/DinJ family antitoxin